MPNASMSLSLRIDDNTGDTIASYGRVLWTPTELEESAGTQCWVLNPRDQRLIKLLVTMSGANTKGLWKMNPSMCNCQGFPSLRDLRNSAHASDLHKLAEDKEEGGDETITSRSHIRRRKGAPADKVPDEQPQTKRRKRGAADPRIAELPAMFPVALDAGPHFSGIVDIKRSENDKGRIVLKPDCDQIHTVLSYLVHLGIDGAAMRKQRGYGASGVEGVCSFGRGKYYYRQTDSGYTQEDPALAQQQPAPAETQQSCAAAPDAASDQ